MSDRADFGYFPLKGERCLFAVRGYVINPAVAATWSQAKENVTFTLAENHPPYRELQNFPSVRVEDAESKRYELIRAHCDPKYVPELRVKRLGAGR